MTKKTSAIENILFVLSKIKKDILFYENGNTTIAKTIAAEYYLQHLNNYHMKATSLNAFNPKICAKKRGTVAKIRAIYDSYTDPINTLKNLNSYGAEQKRAIIQHFTKGEGVILFSKQELSSFIDEPEVNNLSKWIALSLVLTPHEIEKGAKKLPSSVQKALLIALKKHEKTGR